MWVVLWEARGLSQGGRGGGLHRGGVRCTHGGGGRQWGIWGDSFSRTTLIIHSLLLPQKIIQVYTCGKICHCTQYSLIDKGF